ncbi:MAG: ABC transporter permease [Gemmatimonadota bacterium]
MNAVWSVLKREYLERVRKRSFLLATIGGPLLIIALIFGSGFMAARSSEGRTRIAVLDRTGVLMDPVTAALTDADYTVVPAEAGDTQGLDDMVRGGDIGSYLILDDATLTRGEATLVGEDSPGTVRRIALQSAITRAVIEQRFGADTDTEDVARLVRGGDLEFRSVDQELSENERELRTGFTLVGAFFLYFALLLYGVFVMQAVLEEKTSRMAEIVVSAVRPWQLMLGKIVGVGLVGLTQIAVWVLLVVLAGTFGLPMLVATRPELATFFEPGSLAPAALTVVWFTVFFVLGYLLYSGLYAAVGAMCSTEEETRQLQLPVTMMLVIPFVMMIPALEGAGDTPLLAGMSLFPLFTPLLMFARAASGTAPFWQIGLSIVLTVLAIVGVAWIAGRIYRVGILMQGKRPTLPELWRWVREA